MGLLTRKHLVTKTVTVTVEAGSEQQALEFANEELYLNGPETTDDQVEELED